MNASQEEVDAALNALTEAHQKLVKQSSDNSGNESAEDSKMDSKKNENNANTATQTNVFLYICVVVISILGIAFCLKKRQNLN